MPRRHASIAALVLAVALALGGPAAVAQAPDLSPGERSAIRGVIERQLDAFRRDAADEAFGYASPSIQRKFGDPATFMRMVRTGYPEVYRPKSHAFRGMRTVRGQPAQEVRLVGPQGRVSLAVYVMERQPSGRWRIDGVRIERPPDRVS